MDAILFVIFINPVGQLIEHLATILSTFADDTKTERAVNNDKDHQLFQEALDTLVKKAEYWQMSFNANNCEVIQFGKYNKHYVYTMRGNAPTRHFGSFNTSKLRGLRHKGRISAVAVQSI